MTQLASEFATTQAPEKSYFDARSQCRFIVTTPRKYPRLWGEYLTGAVENYRHYGVEDVLEYDEIADGRTTSLFFSALDGVGRVVAGVRVQGPYTYADEAHAVQEWTGHPGVTEVYTMIEGRIPSGVIELKTAWTSPRADRREELTSALSRIAPHAMMLLGVRFAMATAAGYVLDRWASCGGLMASDIPGVPYPDDRYLTRMMWWDKATYADTTDRTQLPAIMSEASQLSAGGSAENVGRSPRREVRQANGVCRE